MRGLRAVVLMSALSVVHGMLLAEIPAAQATTNAAVVSPSALAGGVDGPTVAPAAVPGCTSFPVCPFNTYDPVSGDADNPGTAVIPVSGMPPIITDLSLFVRKLNAPFMSDAVITLVAPDGTPIDLIARACLNVFLPFVDRNFNVDDRASAPLPPDTGETCFSADRIQVSDYAPGSSAPTPLAALNGHAANGDWTIRVSSRNTNNIALSEGFGFILAADDPDTVITSGPVNQEQTGSAVRFSFQSPNVAGPTFECRLGTEVAFAACASPLDIANLSAGLHSFQVRAVGGAAVDPTPSQVDWIVRPETQIVFPAAGATTLSSAAFGFRSPNALAASFECSRDRAAFTSCASPLVLSSFKAGRHTVRVQARISVGGVPVVDPTPAQVTFTVTPPDTRIIKHPKKRTTKRRAKFVFTSNAAGLTGLTFQCKVDKKPFKACTSSLTSPYRVRVKPGRHTFRVRAKDAAGNIDPTPALFRWRVRR